MNDIYLILFYTKKKCFFFQQNISLNSNYNYNHLKFCYLFIVIVMKGKKRNKKCFLNFKRKKNEKKRKEINVTNN